MVGGASKDVGKTSVIEAILRATPSLDWTAVKITLYGADEVSIYGRHWRLRAEFQVPGSKFQVPTDTARFLAASARQALWLTAPRDALVFALPSLAEALSSSERVIVESTSILEFWNPDLFLLVTGAGGMKPSASRFISRADVRVEGTVTQELLQRIERAVA